MRFAIRSRAVRSQRDAEVIDRLPAREALMAESLFAHRQGDLERSVEIYRRIVAAWLNQARNGIGVCVRTLKRYEEAERALPSLNERHPNFSTRLQAANFRTVSTYTFDAALAASCMGCLSLASRHREKWNGGGPRLGRLLRPRAGSAGSAGRSKSEDALQLA